MDESSEILIAFSRYEKEMQEIQAQIEAVEKAIINMDTLNYNLEDLKNSLDKEIFAHLGRGIFVKAKIISPELYVDVGEKIFIKRNITETKKIIEKQIQRIKETKEDLHLKMEELSEEINRLLMKHQGSHKCDDPNCTHEH